MNPIFEKNYIIFFTFLFIYLTLGLCLSYHYDILFKGWDYLFSLDCNVAFSNFIDIQGQWQWKSNVHPLSLLALQPVVYFFQFMRSDIVSVLFVQALVGAGSVCLIKSTIFNFTNNKSVSLLLSLVFGLGFSTLIFSSLPETYIFAALFNLLLLNYISFSLKEEKKISSFVNIFILSVLTVFAFGVIPASLIPNIILVVYFLIKKYGFKKEFFLNIFYFFIGIISLYLIFYSIQKLCFSASAFFLEKVEGHNSQTHYIDTSFCSRKIHFLIRGMFIEPFYAIKCSGAFNSFDFNFHQKFSRFIFALSFWVLPVLYSIINFKKNNKSLIALFSLIVVANIFIYYSYDTKETFLFSQNFFLYFFPLLGLLMTPVKGRFFEIICSAFLIYQICLNFNTFYKIFKWLSALSHTSNPPFLVYMAYALILTIITGIVITGFKKMIKKEILQIELERKYLVCLSLYLIYILISAVCMVIFSNNT